jgi:hypothetical protein
MSISTAGDWPLGSVPYDMGTEFVSSGSGYGAYSTVARQDLALSVPLGSQLNLLNASTAGNCYLDFSRTENKHLGSLEDVLKGYNTLTGTYQGCNGGGGPYGTFGVSYGCHATMGGCNGGGGAASKGYTYGSSGSQNGGWATTNGWMGPGSK